MTSEGPARGLGASRGQRGGGFSGTGPREGMWAAFLFIVLPSRCGRRDRKAP